MLDDVTSVFMKQNRSKTDHNRPVSILSELSEDFERCLHKQISLFFEENFQNVRAVLE